MEWWDRYWAKVDASGDCWEWTAGRNWKGYGKFKVNGSTISAHRFIYEQMVRPLSQTELMDHLCRNRSCVNPDHLQPVSYTENRRRGHNVGRRQLTHCKYGHKYTEANTYQRPDGWRECRQCLNRRNRESRARRQ